jgi:hypothetical protein
MIKHLKELSVVLLLLVISQVGFSQQTLVKPNAAMFPGIIGGICKEATIILDGKKGEEYIYQSTAQQAFMDLETHYFGLKGKLGMFRNPNTNEQEMAIKVLDLNQSVIEFRPDNPSALIKPLELGQSVDIKVPGVLYLSNHKQRLPVNFTFSRDQDGKYHARGGFVVNLAGLEINIPKEYQEVLAGSVRFNFSY